MTFTIRPAILADHPALLTIWFASVRATHTFLTETDIADLTPMVRDQALPNLTLHILCDGTTPIGWIGTNGHKIEALFLSPNHFGQGGGRALIDHIAATHPVLEVDVNEQNPAALAFYQRLGFTPFARSPHDAQGNPFPLLHLRRLNS